MHSQILRPITNRPNTFCQHIFHLVHTLFRLTMIRLRFVQNAFEYFTFNNEPITLYCFLLLLLKLSEFSLLLG